MLPNTFQIQVEKMCIKLHCFLVLQFQQLCLITCYNELFIISDVSNSPHDPGVSFYREAVDICWDLMQLLYSREFLKTHKMTNQVGGQNGNTGKLVINKLELAQIISKIFSSNHL